jgi:hypothetical protein
VKRATAFKDITASLSLSLSLFLSLSLSLCVVRKKSIERLGVRDKEEGFGAPEEEAEVGKKWTRYREGI